VLPITSLALNHKVSTERIATGIPRLDAMLGGRGFFRGSSILVSGTAGTGKTSLMAHFVDAACARASVWETRLANFRHCSLVIECLPRSCSPPCMASATAST